MNNGALDFSSFYSGLFKIINLFFHLSYLFLLHPSRQLAAYCIKLLLLLYLMLILFRIPAANFLSHIPNIFYTDVSIWSASSNLKPEFTLKSSLSAHQINVGPKTFRTSIKPCQKNAHILHTFSIPWDKTNVRAVLVLCSVLPPNTMDSSVNSLNSTYVAKTKALFFKTKKS